MSPTSDERVNCWRCHGDVVPNRPWPHWSKVRVFYFCVLGLALCGAPVILADGFVMIPMLMVVMAAIGPINHLAKQRPTCTSCGAVLGPRPPQADPPAVARAHSPQTP